MPLVLGDETPTARKEHRCQLCERTIRPGEKYHRQRNIGDDGPYVFKNCAHCQTMLPLIDWDWGDGYTYDEFDSWWPERGSVEQWRLKVGWRRRWTHRDGTLYPVPVLS